jgi:hypothetical protein
MFFQTGVCSNAEISMHIGAKNTYTNTAGEINTAGLQKYSQQWE